MKLQCTFTMYRSYFKVGALYDAERRGDGLIMVMQDEQVSDFDESDAWLAFEGICFGDGSRFFEISSVAMFREVQP